VSDRRPDTPGQRDPERRVIALDLTLAELNPNHKYRLALTGPPASRWLADLKFVARDESIYVVPRLERAVTITAQNTSEQFSVVPRTGFHISVHQSGRLNLAFGRHESRELRP
jgi:hypothetical protein